MMNEYDVCIIGAGVVGCAAAMQLSKYDLNILVIDKEEDVCSGTSKANSAIAHAGYDAVPGTIKAKMNVRGAELIKQLSKTLDFSYIQNGSLVLCFDEADIPKLNTLYERGIKNGVKELSVITGDEARALEPAVSENAVAALYAKDAGIVCPFGMTYAFAENAAANGVQFSFLTEVKNVKKSDPGYTVVTDKGEINTKYVINAAGVYADVIHNYVCDDKIKITARRGEYVLLDREVGDLVKHTVFQLPTKLGKGVLVAPTVHGNIIVGPSAEDIDDKEDTETTAASTAKIKECALQSVPNIPYNKVITGFSGLRAHGGDDDFIIGETADGFFDAACIESPGLTSAPAIGEYLAMLISKKSGAALKTDYIAERKNIPHIAKMPPEKRTEMIKKNPLYGNIICRCESISEGEIVDAIRRKPGAVSLDGVKRRVRAGMGRCQAGFCTPATIAILARELGIPESEVTKNRPGSEQIKEKL
ncbi:MAG: NAD(P)/FAD-dependent oxidoreductase [Clostridia bacterium]|nr:NAD(P)/FAD-dependent oxidoreductase [Clostridia bacterium]